MIIHLTLFSMIPFLLLSYWVDRCNSDSFFQVLNQPQESPPVLLSSQFSRAGLYGNSAPSSLDGLGIDSRRKQYRRGRKHRKHQDGGGPDPSPASEENPSGDTGNVAPAFYSFPVILNAKPEANDLPGIILNAPETEKPTTTTPTTTTTTTTPTTTTTTTSTTTTRKTTTTAPPPVIDLIREVQIEESDVEQSLDPNPAKRSYHAKKPRDQKIHGSSENKKVGRGLMKKGPPRRVGMGRNVNAVQTTTPIASIHPVNDDGEAPAADTDDEKETDAPGLDDSKSKGISGVSGDDPSSKGFSGVSGDDPESKGFSGVSGDDPESKGFSGVSGDDPKSKGFSGVSGDDGTDAEAGKNNGTAGDTADGVPFLDFVESDGNGTGNGTSGGGGGEEVGLPRNFTMEEYDMYCNTEENERRKRVCPWNVGMNATWGDDDEKDPPLDFNNLFESLDRTNPDKVVAGEIHHIAAQNRKLMIDTIKAAIWPYTPTETEPFNGFRLLNTTRTIFGKICPPHVVPSRFLNMVIDGFKRLHDQTTPGRLAFLSDLEYESISVILDQCFSNSKPSNYIQNDCKEDVVGVNSTKHVLCLGYILTEGVNRSTACYQTNLNVYDPILDMAWLMFEAVKANCFDYFQGNIRLLHRYSVAMKDMFTKPLKSRWPLQREAKEYWERLLGPGLELAMSNTDKCVHHIVKISKFDFRTPRFFSINTVRNSHTHIQFLQR